jgi:hypothetical protein
MTNLLQEKGFNILPQKINLNLIEKINLAIENSYLNAREIQIKNGIDSATDGTVHHLLGFDDEVYVELLNTLCNSELYEYMKAYFGGNFILNSYGGLKNLPSKPSYVAKVHRDIRFFSGEFPLMLNVLIMLDDFTLENGATYLLSNSHKSPEKPTDEEFYENAERAVGKRGDVLFFNSNLWHAAGINKTTEERRAITITFTKPFMKQQMDYPRAVGYEKMDILSTELQQMIGFYSRVPSNLNEWYQKPENRFYRPLQD